MEDFDPMSREDAERFKTLVTDIIAVIEKEPYTYKDIMRALSSIMKNYEEQGRKLLNSTSILDVATTG